jgi:hypothetical protein
MEKQNAIFLTDHLKCEHIEIQTILGHNVQITYHNEEAEENVTDTNSVS